MDLAVARRLGRARVGCRPGPGPGGGDVLGPPRWPALRAQPGRGPRLVRRTLPALPRRRDAALRPGARARGRGARWLHRQHRAPALAAAPAGAPAVPSLRLRARLGALAG